MKVILASATICWGLGFSVSASAQGTLHERLQRVQRTNQEPQSYLSEVPNTRQMSFEFENIKRTFLVHTPLNDAGLTPLPLVLNFHGGMGTGKRQEQGTGFSGLADKENFIVVYPDGLNNQWNDGRGSAFFGVPTANDVGFVSALLDYMEKNYRIDPKRVYATGASNGGIFSHRLGLELSDRLAAIAPVVANLALDQKTALPLTPRPGAKPVSVLMINGTADPLMKWGGGGLRGTQGRVAAVPETVATWVRHDACRPTPQIESLPDKFADDGTTVRRESYSGGKDSTEVVLYAIVGGGHGWHGSQRRRLDGGAAQQKLTGNISREIDSTEVIWEFFKKHPKQ